MKDYVPKAQAAIKAAGGKFLAAGGKTTTIEGQRPKSRVVIQRWDSLEKVQAYGDSAAFKDLLRLRNKLAKFRSFVALREFRSSYSAPQGPLFFCRAHIREKSNSLA